MACCCVLWRKLAKSTLLLVSLFGVQYTLFTFFPDGVSILTFQIWNAIELALASTQVMAYSCCVRYKRWVCWAVFSCCFFFLSYTIQFWFCFVHECRACLFSVIPQAQVMDIFTIPCICRVIIIVTSRWTDFVLELYQKGYSEIISEKSQKDEPPTPRTYFLLEV